jgi:hypothetical protein
VRAVAPIALARRLAHVLDAAPLHLGHLPPL